MEDYEEIFENYMQKTKEELAALLTVDALIRKRAKELKPITFPETVKPAKGGICKDWSDCTNPYADCIDCPLRMPGGYTINTNGTFSVTDVDKLGVWK